MLDGHRAVAARLVVLHGHVVDGEELGDGVADNRPLLGHVARLRQRRVVVVRGGLWLEALAAAVGAAHEAPVGPADEHVEVPVGVHLVHLRHRLQDRLRARALVLLLPVVQPAGVEL